MCSKLIAILCKDEAGNRRQQIQQLQEQREREIADDIREAAGQMNSQARLVAIARARGVYARAKLKEQEDKLAKGTGSVFEVASARLTWLKARDKLVQEVTAWHVAHVQLQEAQGVLSRGCDAHTEPALPRVSPPQMYPPPEATRLPQYRRTYTQD
jgi:outer membrane protein TolC